MKIAYLLMWDLLSNNGVTKKVKYQVDIWQAAGHEVRVFCVFPNKPQGRIPYHDNYHFFSFSEYDQFRLFEPDGLFENIARFSPDIIYLRYELWKYYLSKIIKIAPTIIELNSDDITEYRAQKGLKGFLKVYYNLLTRDLLLGGSAGLIGVTHELLRMPCNARHNKPSAIIPNGIPLCQFPLNKIKKHNSIPQLVFIGSPRQAWHGVDKILRLAEKTEGRLQFHIIGLSGVGSPNVTYYGYLPQNEYEDIIRKCDIGIGTLALHRKNMLEACPLKVREYLAYGLPIIIGYQDTAFLQSGTLEWVLQLENREENVDEAVERIVDFCYKMKDKIVNHEETGFIDINYTERKRLDFFESINRMKQ